MWSRPFLLACLTNATMGILYVWSMFLAPLEARLGIARAALSLVPALSLAAFTAGMLVHGRLLQSLSLRSYATLAFGLAGGGFLLFALIPSFLTLTVGYGLAFGSGSGLGYGLALVLVTQLPARICSMAIGLVMAAFAISGVILSNLLAGPIRTADPAHSFLLIGLAIVAIGIIIVLGSPQHDPQSPRAAPVVARHPSFSPAMSGKPFLMLGFAFFIICYTGLMVVAHATGLLAATGLSPGVAGLAAGSFNVGYILGCLAGGRLVEALSGGRALTTANLIAAAGLLILFLPGSPVLLLGVFTIGAVFGGSASLMPVLIGEQYGVERIGDIYGKLMVAYGVAGLTAPWITGQLYSATGSYALSLTISLAMCAVGAALGLTIKGGR